MTHLKESADWVETRLFRSFLASVNDAIRSQKQAGMSKYRFCVPVELNDKLDDMLSYYDDAGLQIWYDNYSHEIEVRF